jgi:hypothetical protein
MCTEMEYRKRTDRHAEEKAQAGMACKLTGEGCTIAVLVVQARDVCAACLQDFLRAGQVLCIASDKSGQEERVVLPEAHTLTDLPLVSPR